MAPVDRLFVDRSSSRSRSSARPRLRARGQRRHRPRRARAPSSPRAASAPTSRPPGSTSRPASICPAQDLSLDLQGSETGGLLAAATGRAEAGALRLSLGRGGPLSGWRGRLAVDAERLAKLDLEVDLAYAERKRLAVTGVLDAAPGALPPELADIVGMHADLSVRAGETAPHHAVEALTLRAASIRLSGSGSADLAADTVEGAVVVALPDLTPFSGLAATPLAGRPS